MALEQDTSQRRTPVRAWAIQIRVTITETDRLALGAWYGEKPGKMVTLATVRRFLRDNGLTALERAVDEYLRDGRTDHE